jgi:twitching motility two-component system response regulator PilH
MRATALARQIALKEADIEVKICPFPVPYTSTSSVQVPCSPFPEFGNSKNDCNQTKITIMITVLVVEDTMSEQQLITLYLQEAGYKVINANNGKDALSKVSDQKPDVVVTDVVMPGMNGFELCRSLKKNPDTQKLPVIACTSKNQELDRLWGMKQGVDVYVTKPFTREEIVRAIRSVAG